MAPSTGQNGKTMIELISIHIAKTGGRSFYEILKHEYGNKVDPRTRRNEYFPDKDYSNPLITRIPDHVSVIHGHLFYEHVREIHQKHGSKVITWLREPVERVISNYFFLMRAIREAPETHPQRNKRDYTLLEYANDSLQNKMAKYLRGISLENLFFFGFQEGYDQGLNELAKLLSWEKPILKICINKGPEAFDDRGYPTRKEDITPGMRKEIARLNEEDHELYREALVLKSKTRGH